MRDREAYIGAGITEFHKAGLFASLLSPPIFFPIPASSREKLNQSLIQLSVLPCFLFSTHPALFI